MKNGRVADLIYLFWPNHDKWAYITHMATVPSTQVLRTGQPDPEITGALQRVPTGNLDRWILYGAIGVVADVCGTGKHALTANAQFVVP